MANALVSRNPMQTSPAHNLPSHAPWWYWTEPWYVAYALLGVTATGVLPILLPLTISHLGSAADIGLVMAAISLGGLLAPVWGRLADRYRVHRWLLTAGLGSTAVCQALFPFATSRPVWLLLAFLQGCGTAGAATLAYVFIIGAHPEAEWDARIAWLQTFSDTGHVVGLRGPAGLRARQRNGGCRGMAGRTALAAGIGWRTTRTPRGPFQPKPTLVYPTRHGEGRSHTSQQVYHHAGLGELRALRIVLRAPFGLFLTAWLFSLTGSSAFFVFYPVLVQEVFGIAPSLSSVAFALAVSLRLILYAPAGYWSHRLGPRRLLRFALGMRCLAFLGMFRLGWTPGNGQTAFVFLGLILVILVWALLSVSGTALTAHLSPIGKGEGLGLFNAATALAGILGAIIGGWLATQWFYNATAGLAVVGLGIGRFLTRCVRTEGCTDF